MRYAVIIAAALGFAGPSLAHGGQTRQDPNHHSQVEKNMSQQYDKATQQLEIFRTTHDVEALSSAISLASALPDFVTPSPLTSQPQVKDKLSLLLAIFGALDTEIAPDFDPDEVPELTVEPPPESGLPAGVAPASIKDPKVRKAYEESLAANSLKNQRYRYQYALRQEDLRAEAEIEKIIAPPGMPKTAYSIILKDRLAHAKLQPHRLAKLQALLVR